MQTAPSVDTRNIFQRGMDRVFFDPRKEPFNIDWTPMFDRIQEAKQEVNEINMVRARLKGNRAAEAEKAKQAAKEAKDHLEAASSGALAWIWKPDLPTPPAPQEISIATPPSSVSSKKARSVAASKAQSEPSFPVRILTTDNPLRRYMLAANPLYGL